MDLSAQPVSADIIAFHDLCHATAGWVQDTPARYALGVWQQINPPTNGTAKTIDLRMAGMEVRATNEQGQVYVYDNQNGWTLAD